MAVHGAREMGRRTLRLVAGLSFHAMGNVMSKQKFSCKGVVRATGQRASVVISADSREAALQIADKHGVTVESIMPMAEPAPVPPKVAPPIAAAKKAFGEPVT